MDSFKCPVCKYKFSAKDKIFANGIKGLKCPSCETLLKPNMPTSIAITVIGMAILKACEIYELNLMLSFLLAAIIVIPMALLFVPFEVKDE